MQDEKESWASSLQPGIVAHPYLSPWQQEGLNQKGQPVRCWDERGGREGGKERGKTKGEMKGERKGGNEGRGEEGKKPCYIFPPFEKF